MRVYLIFFSLLLSSNVIAATYDITFNGIWNANQVDSGTYPSSAHFSTIIGTTHTFESAFWQRGETASQGVEDVAELGVVDALQTELTTAQQADTAGETFLLSSQFNLPKSQTIRIEVDDDKPYLSLITMIAPSPDWFVGVTGLALQENGQWLNNISVDMHPYDAGTEDGTAFSLSNNPTSGGVIRLLSAADSPFIGSPVIATIELSLIDPPSPPTPPVTSPTTPQLNTQVSSIPSVLNLLLDDEQ